MKMADGERELRKLYESMVEHIISAPLNYLIWREVHKFPPKKAEHGMKKPVYSYHRGYWEARERLIPNVRALERGSIDWDTRKIGSMFRQYRIKHGIWECF